MARRALYRTARQRALPHDCPSPFPHPNDRAVEAGKTARAVGSLFVRKYMLSPAEGISEWESCGTCRSRTRRWKSVCQRVNARTGYAWRFYAPEWWNANTFLSALFPAFTERWGMGLRPMFTQALALSYPSRRAAELAFPARAAGSPSQRIKASA